MRRLKRYGTNDCEMQRLIAEIADSLPRDDFRLSNKGRLNLHFALLINLQSAFVNESAICNQPSAFHDISFHRFSAARPASSSFTIELSPSWQEYSKNW